MLIKFENFGAFLFWLLRRENVLTRDILNEFYCKSERILLDSPSLERNWAQYIGRVLEKVVERLSNNKLQINWEREQWKKMQKYVPSFKLLQGCESAIGDDMQEMDQSK
jgi:hypothetical protein